MQADLIEPPNGRAKGRRCREDELSLIADRKERVYRMFLEQVGCEMLAKRCEGGYLWQCTLCICAMDRRMCSHV